MTYQMINLTYAINDLDLFDELPTKYTKCLFGKDLDEYDFEIEIEHDDEYSYENQHSRMDCKTVITFNLDNYFKTDTKPFMDKCKYTETYNNTHSTTILTADWCSNEMKIKKTYIYNGSSIRAKIIDQICPSESEEEEEEEEE